LAAVLVAAVLLRPRVAGLVDQPALQIWSTFFVSIVVQALPFLTLGVVLSGGIAALLSAGRLARVLPARPSLAVPIAGLAGATLPGCEAVRSRSLGGSPPAAPRRPPPWRSCSAPPPSTRWCWSRPPSPSRGSRASCSGVSWHPC